MSEEKYELMDGRLHVYRRENSRRWQCSTYLNGHNHRATTKEDNVVLAMEFAKNWYMERYVEARQARLGLAPMAPPTYAHTTQASVPVRKTTRSGKTFADAAAIFLKEYRVITQGERSEQYVKSHEMRLRVHLLPYFGQTDVANIDDGLMQKYRIHRHTTAPEGKRPARNTLHQDTVTCRLVLKAVHRLRWIEHVPSLSPPYKTSGKIKHRAWFSPKEYKVLYEATRERAKHPRKERWRTTTENLHDYILFMVNTGLRPDEAARLEYRDVSAVKDEGTAERILEIEVRGKRGVGYCKSMPGAVRPFERMRKRHNPKPTDLIFGKTPSKFLSIVLNELGLKKDRDGNDRTAYSLRHTYICLRLMEGADIYQVAKNCRTSVEMIEKYYAVHLKNTLDASAINVRKGRTMDGKQLGK